LQRIWRSTAAAVLVFALVALGKLHAQALPTAYANVRLSAFGGVSGNYTGLQLAKNLDVTAGVDVGFRPFAGFYPVIEARGMYPVDSGSLIQMRNLLGGIRLGRRKDRFAGYGDVLFGRGQLNYLNGGQPNATNTLLYTQTISNVYSLGGGVDWDWTEHFGLKGDFQLQHYNTPVTPAGDIYSKVFTAGLIYRFGSGSVR
jgi:hypothetical protein